MLSKTKFKKRIQRKTNPIVRTFVSGALKNESLGEIVKILSGSTKKIPNINFDQLDKKVEEGDEIIFPGKILSKGQLTKKIKIHAISISSFAKERLSESKSTFLKLDESLLKSKEINKMKMIK